MSKKQKLKILIIDDSEEDTVLYTRLLKNLYDCDFEYSKMAVEGLDLLQKKKFDIIYLDYSLPDMTGIDFIVSYNNLNFDYPIIVFTGQGDEEIATRFLKLGASDYIAKNNLSENSMRRATDRALENFHYKKLVKQKHQALYHFSDILAHDLKSPINRINKYSSIIKDKKFDDLSKYQVYADSIYDDSQYCLEFINALYLYSKIGRSEKTFTNINLNDILKRAITNLSTEIENRSTKIIINDLPNVIGDKITLIQLFQNLISNSMKFSSNNIEINIYAKEIDNEYYMIFLSDNGIGIPSDKIASIFEPFKRLSKNDGFEGFGLGLALCQMIVNQHKGEISVNSKIDHGTTFSIKLPKG